MYILIKFNFLKIMSFNLHDKIIIFSKNIKDIKFLIFFWQNVTNSKLSSIANINFPQTTRFYRQRFIR